MIQGGSPAITNETSQHVWMKDRAWVRR